MVFQSSLGAPISEVWGAQAQQTQRSRQAPGSGGTRQKQKALKQRWPSSSQQPRASDPCDLSPSDPLCELYNGGYSSSLLEAMDQRTDVAVTAARSQPSGSCGWREPRRKPEAPLAAYPMQPLDSSILGMYDFAAGGPVNFYEDDCDTPVHPVQPVRRRPHEEHQGADTDSDTDTEQEQEQEQDQEPEQYPPQQPSRQQQQRQQQKQPQQQQQQQQQQQKQPSCAAGCACTGCVICSSKSQGDKDVQSKDIPSQADEGNVYVDLTLYVVSGVVLIFILEQFIQMGARLRLA